MKIRKVFEKLQDPDDMFEIFKDIVDDVMLIEFDREMDYEFKKGQIEILQRTQEIYLNPDISDDESIHELTEIDNWGFQFTMPDKRESRKRLEQRIIDIFKRQTGVEVGSVEITNTLYSHQNPEIKILFSKSEWINWVKNLKDFEEGHAEFDEYIPTKYQNIKPIWNYYFTSPSRKYKDISKLFTYIFEVSKGIGLKVDFNRSTLLQEMNIQDGVITYETTYYPVFYDNGSWYILTDLIKMVYIDEIKKHQLINAVDKLNNSKCNLKIDLDNQYQDNVELFAKFLTENVFPLIENKDSKLIGDIEDQFIKLEKSDNIPITSDMSKDKSSITWVCETEFNDNQYLFKVILDMNTEEVKIFDNNKTLIRCSIDELSDALFLVIRDNKLTADN